MKRRILAILLVVSMVNSGTNCVRAENIGAERVAENVEELAEESSLETKDDENKQKEENQTEENELEENEQTENKRIFQDRQRSWRSFHIFRTSSYTMMNRYFTSVKISYIWRKNG